MIYPQELRTAWADTNARKDTAIWRCVDMRERIALVRASGRTGLTKLEAELAVLVAVKEAAIAWASMARGALDAAEAAYYGLRS